MSGTDLAHAGRYTEGGSRAARLPTNPGALPAYAPPTLCPRRVRYMSTSTRPLRDVRYSVSYAIVLPALPSRNHLITQVAISLHACYAMPGTDLRYGAPLPSYAPATRCPALT
eukprot:2910962-Rhodomonas_salina.5